MEKTFKEKVRWYKYGVKSYLLNIKENERNSKNEMERDFYAGQYRMWLKHFAKEAGWKPEWIDKFIQKDAMLTEN